MRGCTRLELADKYLYHRNTIGNIASDFRDSIGEGSKTLILRNTNPSQEELLELLQPLKNNIRAPSGNSRSASCLQENAIKYLREDHSLKVDPRRFHSQIRHMRKRMERVKLDHTRYIALEICIFMHETIDYPHAQRFYLVYYPPDAVPLP